MASPSDSCADNAKTNLKQWRSHGHRLSDAFLDKWSIDWTRAMHGQHSKCFDIEWEKMRVKFLWVWSCSAILALKWSRWLLAISYNLWLEIGKIFSTKRAHRRSSQLRKNRIKYVAIANYMKWFDHFLEPAKFTWTRKKPRQNRAETQKKKTISNMFTSSFFQSQPQSMAFCFKSFCNFIWSSIDDEKLRKKEKKSNKTLFNTRDFQIAR